MRLVWKLGGVGVQAGVARQQLGVGGQQLGRPRAVQSSDVAPETSGPTAPPWLHLHVVWCLLEDTYCIGTLSVGGPV